MKHRQSGFSMLEVMVAMVLVGILTAIAVPGYRTMVQNNRISATTTTLVTAINYARSEASKRNVSLFVNSPDNWSASLTIQDRNGVLISKEPFQDGGGVKITFQGVAVSGLRIRSDGSSDAVTTLYVCDQRPEIGREIIVGLNGRAQVTKLPDPPPPAPPRPTPCS